MHAPLASPARPRMSQHNRQIQQAALHHHVLNKAGGALRFVRNRVPLPGVRGAPPPPPPPPPEQQQHDQPSQQQQQQQQQPYVVIADSFAHEPASTPSPTARRSSTALRPRDVAIESASLVANEQAAPAQAPEPQPSTSTSSSELMAFARYLCGATNGAAPLAARLESLSWLTFHTGRAQRAVLGGGGSGGDPRRPDAWAAAPGGLALLERVYLVGGALADVGAADALYAASLTGGGGGGGAGGGLASNGQRAVAAMDYAALLARYLAQHGAALAEPFVAALPSDELQAKAVHVASRLETRCAVHRLVFERLIERVGAEGAGWAEAAAAAAAAAAAHDGGARGPAAAPVTINVAAHGGAASAAASVPPPSPHYGAGGFASPLIGLFVGVVALASGAVRVVVAVLFACGAGAAKLLALGSLLAAVRAAASLGGAVVHAPRAARPVPAAASAALFGGQAEQQQPSPVQEQQQQQQQQQQQPLPVQQPIQQQQQQRKMAWARQLFDAARAQFRPQQPESFALPIAEALRRQQLRVFGNNPHDDDEDGW